ncbi:ATP-dependent nuclease [Anaerocellum danielii]|uniref:AAA family ATPase n=1 Tax=Anaerocellum danielii TaxID=1387557 RepID=A0ABZ0TXY3_9FIRM|nr:AAA family ATPase [Caldicellulosiruptor danielii]WPX07742.1 AAA family ATPase [Caldicellulosiruptor danielii]
MYLNYLMVKNFKSLKELDIKFTKGKNIIIGRNNAGKSNIIKAIDLVLGESNPIYKNIRLDDFYFDKEKNEHENYFLIYCDLRKNDDEIFEGEELNEERNFFEFNFSGYKPTFNYLESVMRIFNGEENSNGLPKRKFSWKQVVESYQHFGMLFFAKRDHENIDRKFLFCVFDEIPESKKLYIYPYYPSVKNLLIKSFVMPSFRSPNEQLKLNHYSWAGKLFKSLINENIGEEMKKIIKNLNQESDILFGNIKDKIKDQIFIVGFPGTDIYFQMCNDTIDDLYKNIEIFVDDGFKSELSQKGTGIQSAIIIDLFTFYTIYTSNKTSSILCVEEPELFMHPHGCRIISKKLDSFLYNNQHNNEQLFNQVIVTTHNVEILKGSDKRTNIYIISKDGNMTKFKKIELESYKHLLLDNNQNELFFAEKVILCEGYDMYLLKFVAEEHMPYQLDMYNVSVVNVGGKNNFEKYLDLVKEKLKFKCAILADFDFFLRDVRRDEKGNIVKKANIENISRFFPENRVLFEMIKDLRKEIRQKYPKEFEEAKSITLFENYDEIILNLLLLINELKQLGIFILGGEIEDLFLNEEIKEHYLGKEKLSLSSILTINQDILAGKKKISEIIDVNPLKEVIDFIIKD